MEITKLKMVGINRKKILKLIAPNVIDVAQVPVIKEAVLYQLFADKLHILVIGDAGACAKTTFADSLEKLYDGFKFFESRSNISKPGIRDAMLKLQAKSFSCAFFDEFPRMSADLQGIMFGLLQRQKITINLSDQYYSGPNEIYIPANVFATANPKGEKWRIYGNIEMMRSQLPLKPAMLRRFHIPICTRNYNLREFQIMKKKFFSFLGEFEDFYEDHKEEYEFAHETISRLRRIKVNVILPSFASEFIDNLKRFENDLVFPVTGEILQEFKNLVIARARMDESDHTTNSHWEDVIDFYIKVLMTHGLTPKLIQEKFTR